MTLEDRADEAKRRAQAMLDAHKARSGAPLLAHKAMADELRKIGITGPFQELGEIPRA